MKEDPEPLTLKEAARIREGEQHGDAVAEAHAAMQQAGRDVVESYARLKAMAAEYGMTLEQFLES